MISRIGNSVYTKIIWGIMGIYLFNISVDTIDSTPSHLPENLAINDQESIVEIIIEKILGYEDAIEEYDDNDTENQSEVSKVKIDLINQAPYLSKIPVLVINESSFKIFSNTKIHSGFYKKLTPPPKA